MPKLPKILRSSVTLLVLLMAVCSMFYYPVLAAPISPNQPTNSVNPNTPTQSPSASQECVGISLISNVSCSQQQKSSSTDTHKLLKTIISLLSVVLGVIAVIMIIISAIMFITSGGESSRVKTAKSTLMYALIGLVVAVLAQILVHWVLASAVKLS